eukprot:s2183_g12.t1
MDPLLLDAPIGTRVSLVAQVLQQSSSRCFECCGKSPKQIFQYQGDLNPVNGLFTFYDAVMVSHDPLLLGSDSETAVFPNYQLHSFDKIAIYDVCSGMGGFTLGSSPLDIETVAFLDSNALACATLRANFQVPVIHGSVADVACLKELHELKPASFVQLTAGFPCQPFSRQGDGLGLQDLRGAVLPAVLRCAWLLQVHALLLECVDNVLNFVDIQQLLDAFAEHANMHISKLVFDLFDRWPVRRKRFWCHMLMDSFPKCSIQGWPRDPSFASLGQVMPFDALWTEEHELDLLWDAHEQATYFDPAFGNDVRVLTPDQHAPTMLHSWANVLRSCPCGCRLGPLSMHRLHQGGARGFGILSTRFHQVRHFHPEEAALLCTVPLDFHFPGSPRTALCLLGQIAAPLQVLWLQAQLLSHLQEHFWFFSCIDPMHQLRLHTLELRDQCLHRWTLGRMFLSRQICTNLEGHISTFMVRQPICVKELETAESLLIGSGYYVTVHNDQGRLPPWSLLHEGIEYTLRVISKRQARPTSSSSFDQVPPALLGTGLGHADSNPIGLGDTHVWKGIRQILDFAGLHHPTDTPFTLYPFRASQLLDSDAHPAVLANWRQRFQNSNGDALIIFETHGHWTLLAGHFTDKLQWMHYDGLSLDFSAEIHTVACEVATRLSQCLALPFGLCSPHHLVSQRLPYTCGTVALMHVAALLGVSHCLPMHDERGLHCHFQQATSEASHLFAWGKASSSDPLALLLVSKGVPEDKGTERAKQVRDRLGQGQIQQILGSSNPWASLKEAASKPGKMFRLITEAEQQEYINQRAKTKFGAKIPNSKQKKQASIQRGQPLQLDPELFRLNPQHFQDQAGDPVPQISFSEVGADQHGIALCTSAMARHFLENPKSISTFGLALLLVDPLPAALIKEAKLTPMVFPALCKTTDEHTIIMGHILQLGDSPVKRKMAGNESDPDKISTQVIKIQVYKDQFELPWDQFSQSPVRTLLQSMDALKLCKGQNCGVDCPKHHQDIDETLDAVILEVWSRAFLAEAGKTVEPSKAFLFTVFLRIPASALLKLLTTLPQGIYVEPRGGQPREQDEKFKVVWLPGATFTEAQHKCRTYAKSLCLVRLKQKYGIRVRKEDEAVAWGILRPGTEFVDMSIQTIYELFPVPHGTQRQAITQILADWKWKARALQPGKGNYHHMSWRVGACEPPPAPILTAFGADVIISAVKDLQVQESKPTIYATAKTQKSLREPASSSASHKSTSSNADPWLDTDPWGGYDKKINLPSTTSLPSRREELQAQIRQDVEKEVHKKWEQSTWDAMDGAGDHYSTENEMRFTALESGLSELKQQNGQFLQWHSSHSDIIPGLGNAEKAIGEVHSTLNAHQQELHAMGSNFKTAVSTMKEELSGEMMNSFNQQYNKLEALLEKRHKTN